MPYIKKAAALIVGTPEKRDYSHAEVAAQALDIPLIICEERVVEMVPHELLITVDPVRGFVLSGGRGGE
jgi:phosphohistidine swiveling domain-containing protein